MPSNTFFETGECGERRIRIKHWKTGFSIKCMNGTKTLVSTPFDQENYSNDLSNFCEDCKSKDIILFMNRRRVSQMNICFALPRLKGEEKR